MPGAGGRKRIHVMEGPEGVLIHVRWLRPRHVSGTVLMLLLLGALGALSAEGLRLLGPTPVLLLNLFTPVLLVRLHVALAGLVNRSSLRCSRREGVIAVRSGPLPWPRARALPAEAVEELAVARRTRIGGLLVDHGVEALLRSGDHRPVLRGLASAADAELVVRTLSAHLGLGRVDPFDA